MRVTITSSSSNLIDESYIEESEKVINYLAQKGCDLNWGASSSSIMGACYKIFSAYNRKIYGYTTAKYTDDLVNLKSAETIVFDNTFDMKKSLFNDADIIICLPGGLGTMSELLSYLEEIRSNDNKKKIIVYNINHIFDSLFNIFKESAEKKFSSEDILKYIIIVNNYDEFIKEIN